MSISIRNILNGNLQPKLKVASVWPKSTAVITGVIFTCRFLGFPAAAAWRMAALRASQHAMEPYIRWESRLTEGRTLDTSLKLTTPTVYTRQLRRLITNFTQLFNNKTSLCVSRDPLLKFPWRHFHTAAQNYIFYCLCSCGLHAMVRWRKLTNNCFTATKILDLETDFWKLGCVPVLRSLIRIMRASLVQIDTEIAEKYSNKRYAVDMLSNTLGDLIK